MDDDAKPANITNEDNNNDDEQEFYIFMYAKIAVTSVQVVCTFLMIIAFIVCCQAKKIPPVAKFHTQGLLVCNLLANLFSLTTVIIHNNTAKLVVQKSCITCLYCSVSTVAMMAVDRWVAINRPNLYLRKFTFRKCRNISIVIWSLVFLIHQLRLNILCLHDNPYDRRLFCKFLNNSTSGLAFVSSILISCVCYISILKTMGRQKKKSGLPSAGMMKNYKSTYIVPFYFMNNMFGLVLFIFAMTYIDDIEKIYFITTCLTLVTSVIDTAIYVIWFDECKLNLLKIFSYCLPCLKSRIEPMRIQIFDIQIKASSSNDTHQLTGANATERSDQIPVQQ